MAFQIDLFQINHFQIEMCQINVFQIGQTVVLIGGKT